MALSIETKNQLDFPTVTGSLQFFTQREKFNLRCKLKKTHVTRQNILWDIYGRLSNFQHGRAGINKVSFWGWSVVIGFQSQLVTSREHTRVFKVSFFKKKTVINGSMLKLSVQLRRLNMSSFEVWFESVIHRLWGQTNVRSLAKDGLWESNVKTEKYLHRVYQGLTSCTCQCKQNLWNFCHSILYINCAIRPGISFRKASRVAYPSVMRIGLSSLSSLPKLLILYLSKVL